MNPDACQNVKDKRRLPFENASDLNKIINGLDELSLRKQLPLRQQTTKPVIKYSASMTKTLHLFSQGDGLYYKKDLTDTNGLYYTEVVVSSDPKANLDTKVSTKPPRQQGSSNQRPIKRRSATTSLNTHIRPSSSSEVATNNNNEKIKETAIASAAISNIQDIPSVSSHTETLQRNAFLRPLSASGHKEKHIPIKNINLHSSFVQNQPESSTPVQRLSSYGSDSSFKRLTDNKAARNSVFQFACTTSTSVSHNLINKQIIKPSSHPSVLSANSVHTQSTDGSVIHTDAHTKPYLDSAFSLPKQTRTVYETITSCAQAINQQYLYNSSLINTKPVAGLQTNTGTPNCRKDIRPDTVTKADLNSGVAVERPKSPSLVEKKECIAQTLAKIGLHGPVTEKFKSIALAEKILNDNAFTSSSALVPHVAEQTQSNDQALAKSQNLHPQLERSNASAHLFMLPTTPEAKTAAKSLNALDKSPESVYQNIKAFAKLLPTSKDADMSNLAGKLSPARDTNSSNRSGDENFKNKQKVLSKIKSSLNETLHSTGFEKVRKHAPSSVNLEKRLSGDGAPVKSRKIKENVISKESLKATGCDQVNAVESDYFEEDDDCHIKEEDDKVDNDFGSEDFVVGERLPGDGVTSSEDGDEGDGLGDFEDNLSGAEVSDDCSVQSSTSSNNAHCQTLQTYKTAATESIKSILIGPTNVTIKPAFRYSLFAAIPPTLNFVSEGERTEQLPWEMKKLLKWKMSPITPIIVKRVLARSGFRITRRSLDWLGCFGKHMKSQCFKGLYAHQKLNHFPGSFQIGRKDKLWRSLYRMQLHYGKMDFNFFPQTYVLPCDMKLLKRVWDEGNSKQKWIIKPPASARGIGIRVISKWSQIPRRKPVIVQRYIHRPFLINSSKFDMRVYVYVSSFDPLRLYVYEDGLARFASCKYSFSTKSLSNRFMHLTNYSVNKKNSEYLSNTDNTVCQGHKWSLKALWNYLKKQGINTETIWDNIKDLVIKTIISGESIINSMTKANTCSRYCCHELFGFDILLDENLKTWVLEVNISPSLHSNSPLDISIKGKMIRDMMNIAGFRLPDDKDLSSNPSTHDFSSHNPSNKFCMDKRLFTNQLAPDQRAKHAFYCQKFHDELRHIAVLTAKSSGWDSTILETLYVRHHKQIMQSILDTITPDDTRILCESIDEDSRKGNFQRLFPTPYTHRYLRYFDQPRYYNLLLDQWVLHYNNMEQRGIMLLQSFCDKGVHLENPTNNPQHQWIPPTFPSVPGIQSSARGGIPVPPIPRTVRKISPKSQVSQSSSNISLQSLVMSPQHPLTSAGGRLASHSD